jgi:hypothetical protein
MLEYHEDFSPYHYGIDTYFAESRNIGWLSGAHDFAVGVANPSFIPKLKELIFSSGRGKGDFSIVVDRLRGSYPCPICGESPLRVMDDKGKSFLLGSAELWVPDNEREGCYFATFGLIIHYVMEHQYQPPQEFIDSVLAVSVDSDFNGEAAKDSLAEKYTGSSLADIR